MKKLKKVPLVVFCCCLFCLVFSACKEKHTHSFVEEVVSPTCTEMGYTTHTCACGESYADTYTEAWGHEFATYVSDGNATCEEDGTETSTCMRSDCNEKFTRTKAGTALGHWFGKYVSDGNAKCAENGTETSVCVREGCTKTHTRTEENSKLGHSFVNYVSDGNAKCEENGTETAVCSRDGCEAKKTRTEENSALGHSFINYVSDGNATCERNGTETAVCSHEDCQVRSPRVEQNSALGHRFENKIATEQYLKTPRTCAQKAVYYISCSSCGKASRTETFEYGEKLPHPQSPDWVIDSTHHWHETTCLCDVKADYGSHTLGDSWDCAVCKKLLPPTEGVEYDLFENGKYAEVIDYKGTSPWVIVADCYNGVPVTGIYKEAFKGASITAILIPDSVTTIGELAFYGCENLSTVGLHEGLTIAKNAFDDCSSLSFTKYDNAKYLESQDNPYYALLSVTNANYVKYTVHENTKLIADGAFNGCERLKEIVIPNSVTKIGKNAFSGCSQIATATVPAAAIPYISKQKLQNLTVTSGELADSALSCCTSLQYVTISDDVTSIGSEAFEYCSGLTSVTIPNSVTSIGSSAFEGCSKLTSVTIPDSVTEIGSSAFEWCSGLTSVYYGGTIDEWAQIDFADYDSNPLYYAEKLYINNKLVTEVNLTTATKISAYAFDGCDSLTSVTIPDSVTSIGIRAFAYCSGLTSITIPDSVTSIGYEAFYGCSGLTGVTIGNGVTSIGDYAFYNCSSLTSITIGNSVTSIGYSAFYNCDSLTSVTIPDSVTSIGSSAFSGCSKLTSVTIPYSVTSIGIRAFAYCSGLTSITIPDSVTSIGYRAFYGCSSLEYATFKNPYGWEYGSTYISSSVLANSAEAAKALKSYTDSWSRS